MWTEGETAYAEARRRGDEGVVAKLADSRYEEGRRPPNWLKFECIVGREFVIGGFTRSQGSRVGLGGIAGGQLRWSGVCLRRQGGYRLRHHHIASATRPAVRSGAGRAAVHPRYQPRAGRAHWVRPEMVAEVGFSGWTRDGKLRHPRYRVLRTDKNPKEVVRERPSEALWPRRAPRNQAEPTAHFISTTMSPSPMSTWRVLCANRDRVSRHAQRSIETAGNCGRSPPRRSGPSARQDWLFGHVLKGGRARETIGTVRRGQLRPEECVTRYAFGGV